MTFNPDDPKWTAYVLGELEESERAELDSLLESSEEARAYVEELRVATGALEHELKVELKVGFPPEINAGLAASLTDAQRAAIQAAAGGSNNIRWFRQPQAHQALLGGVAIAAMILIAIAIPSLWKAQKVDGTANEPVRSAGVQKTEENISPSPAATSESVSKPEGTNEIAKLGDSKVAPTEQREAIVIRDQSDESKSTAPPSPQSLQTQSGPLTTVPVDSPAAVKQEAASDAAVVPPSPSVNSPSGGNNIINDVFPPIAAPRAAAGGAGGRVGGGGGIGGRFAGTAQGGTISGSVSDSSGALIPGVTVTATNTETGVATTTLTNETGTYNFLGLAPGPYRLNATLGGFQTAILVNINLGNAETQRVNIAMKLGNQQAQRWKSLLMRRASFLSRRPRSVRFCQSKRYATSHWSATTCSTCSKSSLANKDSREDRQFRRLVMDCSRDRVKDKDNRVSRLDRVKHKDNRLGLEGLQASQVVWRAAAVEVEHRQQVQHRLRRHRP